MTLPLMPKATAVWLVENTSLTFKQIGDFCGLHELEINGIADGKVAIGIVGSDPIISGQIKKEEIERCEADPKATLNIASTARKHIDKPSKKRKYSPIARRQDKPDGISWILKNYPLVPYSKIMKLLGTTKNTIEKIKDGSHANSKDIRPRDPVLLGLCTQTDLEKVIAEAKSSAEKKEAKNDN